MRYLTAIILLWLSIWVICSITHSSPDWFTFLLGCVFTLMIVYIKIGAKSHV